jgi:two-component system, NarL family, nitrate/nitrite response regulator NarL
MQHVQVSLSKAIRIVIAHDHLMFRDALKRVVVTEGDISVVGEANDAFEAADLTRRLQPDVLLLDLAMRGGGIDVLTAVLASGGNKTRALVLSGSDDKGAGVRALRLGAFGVVAKQSVTALLFQSIRTVANGDYWLEGRDVAEVVQAMQKLERRPGPAKPGPYGLTPREMQIALCVTEGDTNKDIAKRCGISEDTVKHHLSNIFDKLGVYSRLELAMFAVNHAIFDPPSSIA